MKRLSKWLPIIAFIALLLPLAFIVLFSFPTYDDFDLYYYMSGQWSLGMGIKRTIWMYRTWSGDWLATFFQMVLNPLLFFGYNSLGYGIVMLLLDGLFLGTLIFFACTLMNVVCGVEDSTMLKWCVFALIAPFLTGFAYYEIYSWFDGFCYGMYRGFFLMAVAFIIRYYYHATRYNLVMMIIFGCFNCVNLPTCVPIGLIYLYIWWNEPMDRGKRYFRHLIPLMLYVMTALTNVIAPGNYGRQDVATEVTAGVGKSIIYAAYFCLRRALTVLCNWPVLIGLMVLFMLGMIVGKKVTSEVMHPIRLLILMMVGIWGAIVPVAIGYSSWVMPNRICFIFDCLFMMSVGFVLFVTGQFAGERWSFTDRTVYKVIFALVITAGFVTLLYSRNSPWTMAVTSPEAVLQEREANLEILDDIYGSIEEEVTVTSAPVPTTGVYSYVGLTEDSSWPNGPIAYYFSKKDVRIQWTD